MNHESKSEFIQQILNWISSQNLKPPDQNMPIEAQSFKDVFFSVFAGCRADMNSIKIHLSKEPTDFESLAYAKSQVFNFAFSSEASNTEKVKFYKECLQTVAVSINQINNINCVPFYLFVEKPGSPEPFYDIERHICAAAGIGETQIEELITCTQLKSLRKEILIIGQPNIIAFSVDTSTDEMIKVIGLENRFVKAEFGRITFCVPRDKTVIKKDAGFITLECGDLHHTWKVVRN